MTTAVFDKTLRLQCHRLCLLDAGAGAGVRVGLALVRGRCLGEEGAGHRGVEHGPPLARPRPGLGPLTPGVEGAQAREPGDRGRRGEELLGPGQHRVQTDKRGVRSEESQGQLT